MTKLAEFLEKVIRPKAAKAKSTPPPDAAKAKNAGSPPPDAAKYRDATYDPFAEDDEKPKPAKGKTTSGLIDPFAEEDEKPKSAKGKTASGLIDPFAEGAEETPAPKGKSPIGIINPFEEEKKKAALKSIKISPAKASIAVGDKQQFNAKGVSVAGAKSDVTKTVVWSSSDAKIVSIDKDGLATPGTKAGTAKITAKDESSRVEDSVEVTVTKAVLKTLAASAPDRMVGGGTFKCRAWGKDSRGITDENISDVIWSALPANIVSIDAEGNGAALKLGDVTITAEHLGSGLKASTKLKVVEPGAGAQKIDVQITIDNFKHETMYSGLSAFAYFRSPRAEQVFAHGTINHGLLIFKDVWLLREGSMELSVDGPDKGMLTTGQTHYTLPSKGLLKFSAVQEGDKGKSTAATPEEAAKNVGAVGKIGSNIRVEKIGDQGTDDGARGKGKQPKIAWEINWGTNALIIKQA